MADKNSGLFDDLAPQQPVTGNPEDTVTPIDEASLQEELRKEKLYGDKSLEALVGSAAATATFGASDVLARAMGVPAERLAEVREKSPVSSGVGTGLGIAVPAVLSGGESLAAKAIAGPLEATTTAGKIAGEGIEKLVEGRIRSKAAKEIVKNATSMATEGAIFGAGQAVDEAALGKAPLNAQTIVAGVGPGAMLGGLGGGVIGGVKAVAPIVRKGIEPITDKLAAGAKNLVDPEQAALELYGIKPSKAMELEQRLPGFTKELPNFAINEHELAFNPTAEGLIAKNKEVIEKTGEKIGNLVKTLDEQSALHSEVLPTNYQVASRLEEILDGYRAKFADTEGMSAAKLKELKGFQKDIESLARGGASEKISLERINNIRKAYDLEAYVGGGSTEKFKSKVAQAFRRELRDVIDTAATKISEASPDANMKLLATDLKAANRTFAIAKVLEKTLPKKLNQSAAVSLMDLAKGAAVGTLTHSTPLGIAASAVSKFAKSDARRSAVILADIYNQSKGVTNAIKDSVSNFVSKTAKPVKQLSLKSLVNSGFAVDYSTKEKPKNQKEAFKNVQTNLQALDQDSDLLIDRLAKSTARYSSAAPVIAQETHAALSRAISFLQDKLPKDPATPTMFPKDYMPSSIEMAKFERYMQAVEHPLTVLDDVQKGTLTREHVEALKAVYPDIYTELQQEVLQQVAEQGMDMDFNKKMQLGILLDIPTDASLIPTNIAGLQANFMPQNDPMQMEAQQGAYRMGSQTGLQNLDKASRLQTDTQKVAGKT